MWTTSLRLSFAVLIGCALLAFLIHPAPGGDKLGQGLASYFAAKQDMPVAALLLLCFVQAASLKAKGPSRTLPTGFTTRQVWLILGAAGLLLWAARMFVLGNHDLSRDEQMVGFDAAVYARGRLFWPIPAPWREWSVALNNTFLLTVGDNAGWISTYLPLNALLRAVLSPVLPATAISPLLVMVAGLALWQVAGRLWPDDRQVRAVVLILFVTSSQVLVTGTTTYAMTAHLAANLVWLALFLDGRRAAHAAALAVGFVATGLHQPLFHPLFVLPFLDLLRRERRWRTLGIYLAAYAAFGLFWLYYPSLVSTAAAVPPPASANIEGTNYFERFARYVTLPSSASLTLTGANLLRFVTWQNVALLPLAVLGLRACPQDRVCRALWQGIVLLVLTMALILPAQVNGWGYRYLHGFVGSAILIAGYGWRQLQPSEVPRDAAFRWATILSLGLVAVHLAMAARHIAPYAEASRMVRSVPADIVVVDAEHSPYASDIVFNQPDLGNRPILLLSAPVPSGSMPRLCRLGSIAFVPAPALARIDRHFGLPAGRAPSAHLVELEQHARDAGCRIVRVDAANRD